MLNHLAVSDAISQSPVSEIVAWCLEEVVHKFYHSRRPPWTFAAPVPVVELVDFAYSIDSGVDLSKDILRHLIALVDTASDTDSYTNN